MERFPCPIYASSTRPRNSNYFMWTWNWPRVTTGRGLWRRKPPQVSRSTAAPRRHRVCAAFSTTAKSPQESSRYEHRTGPSRSSPSPRLHPAGIAVSLYRGDAFWLLHGSPVSRVHRRTLGQAHDHLLEQTSRQETRQNRTLSEERDGLPPLLPPPLSADRTREHPQSPRTRNRIHPPAHRNARFRSPE